jgi:NAD+ synthase (glutamine-hydrolysing)
VKLVKVAAGVLNQTPLDWDGNVANILGVLEDARQQGVSILCLPELCITGYGCEDAFYAPDVAKTAMEVLLAIVPHAKGIIVSLGLPLRYRGGLFNMACLVCDGAIQGMVGKQNLAGEGIHYEPRWFKAWPNGARADIPLDGQTVPVGDLIFDCGGVKLGFEICEDAWVLDRPGGELAQQGVDIILNPSASHFAFGKNRVRRRLVLDGSRAFHASYVYANLLGNEAGRAIYDGDAMIASNGKLVAFGPRFSYADHQLVTALIDVEQTRTSRAQSSSFPVEVDKEFSHQIGCQFKYPESPEEPTEMPIDDWEQSAELKEEEFLRAIALGLFDYLRKSRSRGFVVSLSGGADSAAVAVLASHMVQLAVNDIGRQRFREKLAHIERLVSCRLEREVVGELLTCAYQSTQNSSDTTREAARAVADGIGAKFLELDVDHLVTSYVSLVSDALDRELTWHHDDLALQNIQARARGPSVWLLANLDGALLLATSNRSEAAVGYATMDGDTCGGLSPIAGIDKAFLRHWLRWMEQTGPDELGPLPILNKVNEQQPTAELRPRESGQTDESDLMPYDVLDAIERAGIRDKQSPRDIWHQIQSQFPGYSPTELGDWVIRFFTLFCRNQWKRERYAPSFHLDDENLDPKTWYRFPILSGGYRRELRELKAELEKISG